MEKVGCSGEVDYIDLEDGRASRSVSRRASVAADMVETFEKGAASHSIVDPDSIR